MHNPYPPATMRQARHRWRTFTRKVLSNAAKEALREHAWAIDAEGYPRITASNGAIAFRFCCGTQGDVFAEIAPR